MTSSEHIHITKDGRHIPVSQMSDQHLANTIAHQKRAAAQGIVVGGVGGWGLEGEGDFEVIYDDEALEYLDHSEYVKELKRRKNAQEDAS